MSNAKIRKSDATRKRILSAFECCVAENGYAATKLIDIADAAGLATPHLRYYFKNKESILEYQYERLVAAFVKAVGRIEADTPLAWFEALGHLIFDTGPRSPQALLVLIEANTLVARSDHMKMLKREYDKLTLAAIEQHLLDLNVAQPDRVAAMVFSFLTGLTLNTAFDQREREAAIPLFLSFVSRLTGGAEIGGGGPLLA